MEEKGGKWEGVVQGVAFAGFVRRFGEGMGGHGCNWFGAVCDCGLVGL